MIRRVVCPGSFDPFTNGHLAVVKKAAKAFDEVIVLIAVNPDKKRRYPVEDMLNVITEILAEEGLTNVKVAFTDGFVADYASEVDALYLVKGIRTTTDYAYEEDMADKNERMSNIDTLYFRAGSLGYLSSSYVMALFKAGKKVDELVPRAVLNYMTQGAVPTPKVVKGKVLVSYRETGSLAVTESVMTFERFAEFMKDCYDSIILCGVEDVEA